MKGKECEKKNPWTKLNHIQTVCCGECETDERWSSWGQKYRAH